MAIENHEFWDTDVEYCKNSLSNADVCEIGFRESVDAFNISKTDVIALANHFDLLVFESDSQL